jgi:hypothetical protein
MAAVVLADAGEDEKRRSESRPLSSFLSHLFTAASPKATAAAAMVAVRGHGHHPVACPWSRSSHRLPFYLSSLLLFSSPPSSFCFLA